MINLKKSQLRAHRLSLLGKVGTAGLGGTENLWCSWQQENQQLTPHCTFKNQEIDDRLFTERIYRSPQKPLYYGYQAI